MNYLYIGIDNPIEIVGYDKSNSNYTISIAGGQASIVKLGQTRYNVLASAETKECWISVIKNNKTVLRKQFEVREIGKPFASLAGMKDTVLKKNHLLINPFLSIIRPGFFGKEYFRILSFRATFISGSDSLKTESPGSILSKEQIDLIRNAESNTTVYFNEIRAICADCRAYKLAPFWLKLE